MSTDVKARAEARLAAAAAALNLTDPRAPLRARLKQLRETQPDGFDRAVAHYDQQVLPVLADDGGDALATWLEYVRWVGQLTSNGRLTAIDPAGRAASFKPPLQSSALVLFVPEDTAADVLVAAAPLAPSAAQSATIELLVNRRLAL